MNYKDYLEVKKAVIEEDATVNYVAEKLQILTVFARCLTKDWKEQQDKIERLNELKEVWKNRYLTENEKLLKCIKED